MKISKDWFGWCLIVLGLIFILSTFWGLKNSSFIVLVAVIFWQLIKLISRVIGHIFDRIDGLFNDAPSTKTRSKIGRHSTSFFDL